jgi:O-methyltransferase
MCKVGRVEDIELTGVKQTLKVVLQTKAVDNQLPEPILGDTYAEQVMRKLDPDYDKRKGGTSQMGMLAVMRAKVHDDWARAYLADHPDAVVAHLGCGLDARAYRVDPPATVEWYDLDFADVIELRRRLLPPRDHYHLIGSSVTELSWLDQIPRGRPVVMIAEGLLPYLPAADVKALITTIVDEFPTGQIQCDIVPPWVARTSKYDPNLRKLDITFQSGFASPRVLADWRPGLEFVDEADVSHPAQLAQAPAPVRLTYAMMNALPFMRRSYRVARYRF